MLCRRLRSLSSETGDSRSAGYSRVGQGVGRGPNPALRRMFLVLILIQTGVPAAWAWGARVHRMLTDLALAGLPADAPEWLRSPETSARAAFQSNQPDRWRGWTSLELRHMNEPEHYLDVEELDQFGLTLETIPALRGEYLRVLAVAKYVHPEQIAPYDAAKDPARTHEWPGLVLHAAAERYAKLQAAFQQVRILEKLNRPTLRMQLDEARGLWRSIRKRYA